MNDRRVMGEPYREWWMSACAAIGTLALHILMLASFTLGASASTSPRKPDNQGPGASAIVSSAEFLTMVLVEDPDATARGEAAFAELASRGFAIQKLPVRILSPDPNPAYDVEEREEHDAESQIDALAGDSQNRALMFGRYVGQISARIARAWIRPCVPPAEQRPADSHSSECGPEDAFSCRARILQDAQGKVMEVMLLDCNANSVWQQSLVNAIQQASPLPAPPHPAVFTSAMTLTFKDRAHGHAGSQEVAVDDENGG